jgi:very-short-patch-repair endonuclease
VIGNYIVDFANLEGKVVIELDGGHHNEDKTVVCDEERATWLSGEGYNVLRFWNNEVLTNMDGVLDKIREAMTPSP